MTPKVGMTVRTPEGDVGKIIRVYSTLVTIEVKKGNSVRQILINPNRLERLVEKKAKKKK